MLCIIDEFTREALAIKVVRRLNSTEVIAALSIVVRLQGLILTNVFVSIILIPGLAHLITRWSEILTPIPLESTAIPWRSRQATDR